MMLTPLSNLCTKYGAGSEIRQIQGVNKWPLEEILRLELPCFHALSLAKLTSGGWELLESFN